MNHVGQWQSTVYCTTQGIYRTLQKKISPKDMFTNENYKTSKEIKYYKI